VKLFKPDDITLFQLLKSVLSSALSFAVDFILYILLSRFAGLYYILANTLSYLTGTTLSYVFSVRFIFSQRSRHPVAEYGVFALVGITGLLLNNGFLFLFVDILSIPDLFSKVLAGSTVFFYNFSVRKILLFSNKR
jgi:putative flippase GtrA